jgi:hypothetical protein
MVLFGIYKHAMIIFIDAPIVCFLKGAFHTWPYRAQVWTGRGGLPNVAALN